MPEDVMVPAGEYKLVKQFRREQEKRRKKDLPWSKRVFDIDEHKLFGRTAWAWFRIVCFYLVLYTLLILIVAFWIGIFMLAIIDPHKPRWLKGPPGLSMVPYNTTAISFYEHLMGEVIPIADGIDAFLNKLNDDAIEFFNECNQDEMWGYVSRQPCVFIKLNKVIGFQPETYDTQDDLPKEVPAGLDETLRKYGPTPKIWITCEVIHGPKPEIVFFPGPYYEASEKMTGVQRVVAVQMNNMPANSEVNFVCKVWARNIPIDDKFQGKGQIKFTMHVRVDTAMKRDPPPEKNTTATPVVTVTVAPEPEVRPEDRRGELEMPPKPPKEDDPTNGNLDESNAEPLTEPPS
ncbi:sodium/potassium-transporting ATPase subunit beta-1 [Drosophila biarmipes]|uniref:sodium/potassium-transporting ATPase subunit beta-1 n=1 Tax=Drosophila biarmipes TaxID=125945 RepID=UPI0007E7A69B|nr:sodium/potassium-transporting ATPase subunit beta-1 [Drosophila biarmipes]